MQMQQHVCLKEVSDRVCKAMQQICDELSLQCEVTVLVRSAMQKRICTIEE